MRILFALIALVAMFTFSPVAKAGSLDVVCDEHNCLEVLFNCKAGGTCLVGYNTGGQIDQFKAAAKEVLVTRTKVRIIAPCASACVIFADKARKNICITKSAVFQVHKGTLLKKMLVSSTEGWVADQRFDPPQSPDIDQLVRAHGGYPSKGLNAFGYKDALRFWKPCT